MTAKAIPTFLWQTSNGSRGLEIQQKESSDPDLYEIAGIPSDNFTAQTDYAIALAKISAGVVRVPRRLKS